MYKTFYRVSVEKEMVDGLNDKLLFESYKEDYDEAKKLANKIKRDLAEKGYKKSFTSKHDYLGDWNWTWAYEKASWDNGFSCTDIEVDFCNEGWMEDYNGKILFYSGDGKTHEFNTEDEAMKYVSEIEKKYSWNW